MVNRILFISSDKKKWNKTEKDRKNMVKAENENNTNESDFSRNEILDLNYLNPFKFEWKTNRVIKSSSSDDQKQLLLVVLL